ncbi:MULTISPECIES: HET-C-related protein [unclassified Pseudomonas]|uniref:HET-C-related protein n=1 Tax=unclassified Pseudomonas TaxID=196821 RepID=UPI0038500F70
MTVQPQAITSIASTTVRIQSTVALDILTGIAANLPLSAFTDAMARVYSQDIPECVYAALQGDLIAGKIPNPAILLDADEYLGDYDNRQRVIRIHPELVRDALSGARSDVLFDVLLHEFGHHIDNLLRHDFTDLLDGASPLLAEDASGEEGARFSLMMACLGASTSARLKIATCQYAPDAETIDISVGWEAARQSIVRRHDANTADHDHRHENPNREAFEAGDGHEQKMTHREIEKVLNKHGFDEEARQSIYFGNWLRDYSQLLDPKIVRSVDMPKDFPDVLSREALTKIVDVLSIKHFADLRKASAQDYTVTPDKLGVYRPSEHIDNPRTTNANAVDPITRDPDFEPVVQDGDPLLDVDYDTSMKRYIERSIAFMESELRVAIKHGLRPEGYRAFGSALHVLEDFFAHSNFVELALIKNGHAEVLPWTSPADCAAGLPLVTGMFGPSDALASIGGTLGDILFSIEDVTYQPQKPGDRSTREQILSILLAEHHNPRYLEIFEAYLSTRDAWVGLPFADFLQRCAAYLQGASGVTGNAVAIAMKEVLNRLSHNVDDWQTRYGQDPHENGSTNPTHSQLAKDHAEHPLHTLAGSLAAHAVGNVAKAMVDRWYGDPHADPVAVARSFFKHPADSEWQDAPVKEWAERNPEGIRRSASKTELLDIRRHAAETGYRVVEQMEKDGLAYLNFMRGEFLDKDSPLWVVLRFTLIGLVTRALLIKLEVIK